MSKVSKKWLQLFCISAADFCDFFTLLGSLSSIASAFVSASPSPTWAALCSPSPSCPSSQCSREASHKVPEPKRPSPPPGRTTRWTSAWTSWLRVCSLPSPCSPASTPCNKVRGAAEPPWCSARACRVATKLRVIYPQFTASADRKQSVAVDAVKCSH